MANVYRRRVVDRELDALLPELPAILLDGPKGVGKTATALQRAQTIRRLDEPAQQRIAEGAPDSVLAGTQPVLIDEWPRVPSVWDAVKRAVDRDNSGGQYLLTGSAPTAQMQTHSGAARIPSLRMRPMTLPERGLTDPAVSLAGLLTDSALEIDGTTDWKLPDYVDAILQSGFPALADLSAWAAAFQLDGYIDRIVERDLPEAGLSVRKPATLRAWLRAYAAATSTTASWETIRDAAHPLRGSPPARSTTLSYIDVLANLRILDEVPATSLSANHLRELSWASKHNLVDPALAARLVGVNGTDLLAGKTDDQWVPRDGTFLGALFESLTALTMRVFGQAARAKISHLRTRDGKNEVDFIVEAGHEQVVAVEVKLSGTVDDSDIRHLNWLRTRIPDRIVNAVVINTGPQAFRRPDGIAVIPLALLAP